MYQTSKSKWNVFLDYLSEKLTTFAVTYDNFNLESSIKTRTRFKSNNPSCKDLIISNKAEFFKNF